MSKIRGKDTGPELALAAAMAEHGWEWESHARDLSGRPDFVFRDAKVVVFVDGDFWHGWLFSQWRDKLSEKWETKIESNRRRDDRNHRVLRRAGWTVVRIWEHQIEKDIRQTIRRIATALNRISL